jgi:dimethylamine/trimethylamine dehydrogenase
MAQGKQPPGQRVVVYDTDGYYVGPGVAEFLAGGGFEVHLVTTYPVVSPISDGTLEGSMLRKHLNEVGVTVHCGVTITDLGPEQVAGFDEFDGAWSLRTDATVLVTQRRSEDRLYRELTSDTDALTSAGIEDVYRIGDAVAPRMISEAVFDGHRLAREIDSSNPARPLPYLRERPNVN